MGIFSEIARIEAVKKPIMASRILFCFIREHSNQRIKKRKLQRTRKRELI